MTKIAFLGLGAMGSRMAKQLIDAGYDLTVWNRNIERAQPFSETNARIAETPRIAAKDADIIFSMVRDDEASDAIWLNEATGAMSAMKPGAVAVECSTLTVEHVQNLAGEFQAKGCQVLDAPVAGSRPQAEAGRLIFLVGGAQSDIARVQPLFEIMGSAVHHAGNSGAGAAVKLMINALFGTQLAAIAELIGFAQKAGMDVKKTLSIIASTPVCSPAVKNSAEAMMSGNYAPAFPIDLAAKDFQLINRSASHISAQLPVTAATGSIFEEGITKNIGNDNITGIVQLYNGKV